MTSRPILNSWKEIASYLGSGRRYQRTSVLWAFGQLWRNLALLTIDTGETIWFGETSMKGEKGELWRKLCEQAAVEQDPEELLELTKEINRLLDEKEARLQQSRTKQQTA